MSVSKLRETGMLTSTTARTTAKGSSHTMNTHFHRDDNWSGLLEKVGKHQDQQAFAQLFEHFAPLIKGFCQGHSSGLSAENAEELVQEVMFKIWQKAPMFDATKSAASTWVFTIVRNSRIDFLRKNSRHTTNIVDGLEADDIWDESLDHQPFVYLQQSRDEGSVKTHLASLPEEQSHCLKKVYMEGKSHAEISEELKLPLGTVKSRVRLGLKKLQSSVQR